MYQAIQIYMIPITCLFKLMHCCPSVCICNTFKTSEKHSQTTTKVVCTPHNGFNVWNDMLMQDVPNNTVLLVIQSPMLTVIPSFTFSNLNGLKKLDLSRNNIDEIDKDAFLNLDVLEKLNLSYNKIKNLNAEIFTPLTSLMRLNLQGNLLSGLDEAHLNKIPSLKFLDISNNPLVCDCHIRWLNEWIYSSKIRLPAKTICQFPKDLQGVPLSRVSEKYFHCQYPLQLSLFELNPNVDQLVFEGDSFILRCQVSYSVPNINITWSLNGEAIKLNDSISYQLSDDASILTSIVHIEKLNSYHSGMWQCSVNSSNGSSIKAIQLLAVGSNGTVCPQTVTSDNKGKHLWPETPSGVTVEVECSGKKSSILQEHHAYHTCTKEGFWNNLNTENCPYVSDVTNVLEHFSKINISFTHSSILASAYLLRNYTTDYKLFNDKMDIIFASRTLQNYIPAVPYYPELAEIIVDVINTLLYLNSTLLIAAEAEDQSCSRLLWILEQLPDFLMDIPLNYVKENIAVEEFFVKAEGFNGIRCSSFMKNNNIYGGLIEWTNNNAFKDQDEKVLNCNIANISADAIDDNLEVEASLQLPATIFQQTDETFVHSDAHKIQFIIYRNSLLFSHSGIHNSYMDITSSIISGKIAHLDARNLSEPVVVSLRTAAYTNDVRPVWWDSQAIGGKGAWSEDGCSISKVKKNIVTFSCNKLASFGLLQNVNALMTQYSLDTAQFHFCHPAIYVGSVPCVVFLVILLSLYCFSYKDIKMPSDTKHSIMNSFTALIFLCIAFTFGIFQSDIVIICQTFGIILHYFTLCALLWMLVSSNNLYKNTKKFKTQYTASSDSIPEYPLPPKPMLRFYLVGWGIPSIIVGISAAVNIENYGGKKLCFLSFKPCLGALYFPAVLILVGICCLYLLIFRELRQNARHSSYPPSALGTPDAVIEPSNDEMECSDSKKNILSDELLLQGHATLLCIFLIAWVSAAASVTRIFQNHMPYDKLLLSVVYCISSLSLGIYSFTFFWWQCPAVFFGSNKEKHSKISKTKIELFPMVSVGEPMLSSNADQEALEEKMLEKGTVSAFDSSSLPATSAFTNSSNNSLNVTNFYYDPWQNVVAKRFFEKCRRQKMHNFHKKDLPKEVVRTNMKLSNTSESSHAISDCKSEPSNNVHCNKASFNISSGNLRSSRKAPCMQFHKYSSLTSSDYKCLSLSMKSPSSEDDNFPSLEHHSNIYPCIRKDILSENKKQYKYEKDKKSKSYYHSSIKLKKSPPYSSFSAEDLKCNYHCCCQCKHLCQISHRGRIHTCT